MQKHTQRVHYPVSPATFWSELCLNLDYQRELYMHCLGCESMEVVRNEGDATHGMQRALRFRKPIAAPAAIRKMFGDAVTMEEEAIFDAQAQTLRFSYKPPLISDHLKITGVTRVEAQNGGVDVVTDTQFRCDLFGLGGLLERFATGAGKDGMLDKERFTRRYIEQNGLT